MDDVNGHPGRRVAPALSPDGGRLLGVAAGDLYVLDLETGRLAS